MSRPVHKNKKSIYLELVICVAVALIMLLTSINISGYVGTRKVLGLETTSSNTQFIENDTEFWNNFLISNPNYVPGWIEIGRIDKAIEIDPNYR